MEVLVVSELASVPLVSAVSSVVPLGAYWGSDPVVRSWVPGSIGSSFRDSLGRVMLDD